MADRLIWDWTVTVYANFVMPLKIWVLSFLFELQAHSEAMCN